jgi:hypothetical protein
MVGTFTLFLLVPLTFNQQVLLSHTERHGPSPRHIGSPAMDKIPKYALATRLYQTASPSRGFLGAIMAFEPNPSGALSILSRIDNAKGVGHVGIDYFELITVLGGVP